VGTHDQCAAFPQSLREVPGDLMLERGVEVRESEVPAQDKVERAVRSRVADVVLDESHEPAKRRSEVVMVASPDEPATTPHRRQLVQAALVVGCCSGPREHRFVSVGGQNPERHGWILGTDRVFPHEREGVRLFAGGAAGAPSLDAPCTRGLISRELRQNGSLEKLEDAAVPVEARDRHVTESVQLQPFVRGQFEVCPVRVDIVEVELANAALNSSTDLATHLPEARPAHPQARQRPLEKLDTRGVLHEPSQAARS